MFIVYFAAYQPIGVLEVCFVGVVKISAVLDEHVLRNLSERQKVTAGRHRRAAVGEKYALVRDCVV